MYPLGACGMYYGLDYSSQTELKMSINTNMLIILREAGVLDVKI
jgi:hypothetical protein